jgi:methionyl-tRNA formyltransferase
MEGIPALEALLHAGAPIRAVLTLTPELAATRSAAADYAPLCERYRVPLYHISNINDASTARILCQLAPDVVFVIGWHQRVRPATLRIPRLGMVAAHASLLPHNRGNAPINWAIIRGEERTGNTLYWMAENPDDIEIIDQTAFPISPYDTCATLYSQVAMSNREMLLRLAPRLLQGERPGWPQPRPTEPLLPRRRPADGRIDWTRPSRAVYDFIRALTRPYPGAFSTLDQQRWLIWRAALPPPGNAHAAPGTVMGPVHSPVYGGCGQMVACGTGAVILLELERPGAELLRGYEVSEQRWTGWRWHEA